MPRPEKTEKRSTQRSVSGCDKPGCADTIPDKIQAYSRHLREPRHRYHSWEHCYRYFRKSSSADLDQDAIHLGFFLASWGMYRGSSFLLQLDYTVHRDAVAVLREARFGELWAQDFDFGSSDAHAIYKRTILDAAKAVHAAYAAHAPRNASQVTATLVTKVILGVLGCLPACDQYFVHGFRQCFGYSCVNSHFVDRVFRFCSKNRRALQREQRRIQDDFSAHYPLMKVVDMYFWQIGYETKPRTEAP